MNLNQIELPPGDPDPVIIAIHKNKGATMSESFERVRDALHAEGAKLRDVKQNHFMSTCPAHEDHNPSLAIDDKGDRVVVHCHAGCATQDVVASLGLELADLFDGDPALNGRSTVIRTYVYEHPNGSPWILKDRLFPKSFRQRLPGTEPGDTHGLGTRQPILYHVPAVARAMAAGGAVIYLVDGEKDVETCERHGLVATCTPGGAVKWDPQWSDFLRHAALVVIVADQDKVKPDGRLGTGQQHAVDARAGLRAVGVKVRIVAPACGKDATDHFEAGYTVDDFVPEPTAYTRPCGMTAAALVDVAFDPLTWAVVDLLPAGLAIIAGSPKCGKTWCALSISLAVASGGPALSCLPTNQGSVLHLAREDGYRRLQSRVSLIMGGTPAPTGLEFIPTEKDWQGGEVGLANMTEWAEQVGNPRLVVIDTLAKVEPEMGEDRRGGAYSGNYSMMGRYKQWADLWNCCVLMVHHDNKTKIEPGSDPFTRISGTRGLTGAADTLLFLENVRGTHEGHLYVTGRDVAEQSLDLYKTGPLWNSATRAE